MLKRQKKKTYEKPKIVYQREIETLAITCDSAYEVAGGNCKNTIACENRFQ